jgi:sugar fermentation stimulation protein A
VEVKSVTLKRGGQAQFPDAVTARGTKHLGELTDQVRAGARAVMFYLVQREDCAMFSIAADIDPDYDKALEAALGAGVEVLCHACRLSPGGIEVAGPLPFQPRTD